MAKVVNSEKVIGNALIEINEPIFDVERIFNIEQSLYENTINTDYYIMGISLKEVVDFCNVYSYFISYNEDSREINLNNNTNNMERMKKYFRYGLDEELIQIFKESASKKQLVKTKIFK